MRSLLYQKIQQLSEDKFIIKQKNGELLGFNAPLFIDFGKRKVLFRNRIIITSIFVLVFLLFILIFLSIG